ncbi:MAG: hypothetical protein AB1374_11460 [Bacillota bacterium]
MGIGCRRDRAGAGPGGTGSRRRKQPLAMGGEAAEESNSGKLREAIIQALATA